MSRLTTPSMVRSSRGTNPFDLDTLLEKHKLWLDSNSERGVRADFSGKYMEGVNLENAMLDKAIFRATIFKNAQLGGASMRGAEFLNTDFRGANLSGIDFKNATFKNVLMQNANLCNIRLLGATLDGVDLQGAYIRDVVGKDIVTFQTGRFFCLYCDGQVKIGHACYPLERWLSHYAEICHEQGYTDDEKHNYWLWLESLSNMRLSQY